MTRILERVVGRDFEERPRRLGLGDVRQAIRILAAARVAVLRHDEHLEIRREPLFRHDQNRLLVADRACGDCRRHSRPGRQNALDHLLPEIFLVHRAAGRSRAPPSEALPRPLADRRFPSTGTAPALPPPALEVTLGGHTRAAACYLGFSLAPTSSFAGLGRRDSHAPSAVRAAVTVPLDPARRWRRQILHPRPP